mgnify:CR=1 FL=1
MKNGSTLSLGKPFVLSFFCIWTHVELNLQFLLLFMVIFTI